MVKVKEDLTGQTFGRLTVLKQVEDHVCTNGKHLAQWLCECNCENHTIVTIWGQSLKRGSSKSCGCYMKEQAKQRRKGVIKGNKYDLSNEYGIGFTSNTQEEFYFDLEDYKLISSYTWAKNSDGYLVSWKDESLIYLHKLIFDSSLDVIDVNKKYLVDHKNRNKLDNRKQNLREANSSENAHNLSLSRRNTTGITGVIKDKTRNKWRATININRKQINLGRYENIDDAIIARLQAEQKYFGEFAPQKDLFEEYGIT